MKADQDERRSSTAPGRLFPHFICRVGGLPAGVLATLRAERTAAACDRLLALEAEMVAAQEGLREGLYSLIGTTDDRKQRRVLLGLRRDVHNLRLLRSADLEAGVALSSSELAGQLRSFHTLGLKRQRCKAEIRELYEGETAEIRRRFQGQVTATDFRKGLLLSSRTLHAELGRYTRAAVTGLSSKEKQIERGLMRYFSRMVMKTTPFSTFCAIIPGTVGADSEGADPAPLAFAGDPQSKRSFLRLNKSVYANFLGHLIRRDEVRGHLEVELNPTLREEDGKWVFLSAVEEREVFQRLARNRVVDLIRELFDETPHLRLSALVERLRTDSAVEATPEEAAAFVNRLLEIGLLRFRIGIPEQEVNWDGPFREILERLDDDHAARVSQLIAELREATDGYFAAPIEERDERLDTASSLITSAAESLEAQIKLWPNVPFFEDAAGEAALSLPGADVAAVSADLVEYVRLTSRLAWPRSEQATMRHFFDDFYGPERRSVPLLQFYEEYFREHFKSHLARQQEQQAGRWPGPGGQEEQAEEEEEGKQEYNVMNPFDLELIEGIRKANRSLSERIQQLWRDNPEAEQITLEREDLAAAVAGVPAPEGGCRSVSVFLHYLPRRDGPPAVVANKYLAGFGKYLSRFLYLVPETVRAALYDSNLDLTDQLLAEICGDANFNANLHPPLLPWEVSYPTGESGASANQLRSGELAVERDPNDSHGLCLRHGPSGKRVIPVDLGFLSPLMRPPLYQLLFRFTPASSYMVQIPEVPGRLEPTAGGPPPDPGAQMVAHDGVVCRPRVNFRRHVVLARRQWRVPESTFPRRGANETDDDYFLRLHCWRRKHGIPDEVFLRVWRLPAMPMKPQQPPGGEKAAPARDEKAAPAPDEKAAPAPDEKAAQAPDESPPAAAEERSEQEPPTPGADQDPQAAAEGDQEPEKEEAGKPAPRPAMRRVRGHIYKPQYVDFRNPLLVDLFTKATENVVNFAVTLEERLPAEEHLVRRGDDRFASELVVQVDFPETPTRGPEDQGIPG